ncbi:MAG: CHAT domain-containing protein [Halobacteriota archaeon]
MAKESDEEKEAQLNEQIAALYEYDRFADAILPAKELCKLAQRMHGSDSVDYAANLNQLARLYYDIGNYEAALPLYREASDINREALGERHPDYAMSIINLGVLYKDMGDYQAAEPLYHEACDILREALGEHHPDYARSLNNLAALFASTDRVAESFDLMMRAAAIEDHTIAQVFAIGSESQRMVYLQSIQGSLHAFLTLTSQRCPRSKFTARAAMDLVLRRKALGAEALAAQRDAVLGGKYPALRERLDQLRTLNNKINQKTFARVDADVLGSYREDLKTLNSRKEQLEAELAHQIPEMRLEEQLKTADSQAVAEVIPDDTALVEFARFDEFDFTTAPDHGDSRWTAARYLAFILRTNAPDQLEMIDLGQSDTIDKMVTEFRANIMYSGQARGDYKGKEDDEVVPGAVPEGTDLRKAVFDPLIPHFDNVTRLFIALDGELTRLPFEALPTDDGRRLIDAYHISYLSVGRDILRFTHQIVHELATSLVIADPDFNFGSLSSTSRPAPLISPQSRDLVRAIQEIPPLPGTEEEGRRIADLLHVHPWLQQNALEGPLKAAASPSVFHIATHGFFLENQRGVSPADIEKGGFADLMVSRISSSGVENPLIRSGLILAGASTFLKGGILPLDAEDGMLTALDVSGLDLLATELAVLSACDTGLGDVQTGEGVFGLRRAFMLAGAKTLVMSLWAVDDEVTKELMIDFYTRILAGEGRADALRNAQLAIKAKHPDPYYWGAFICQGDPGPLNKIQ